MTVTSPEWMRAPGRGWGASILVHGLLLAAALWIGRGREGPVPSVSVRLRAADPMPERSTARVLPEPIPDFLEPRFRAERPRPSRAARPPVRLALPVPPPSGGPTAEHDWSEYDRESVRSWAGHSLAAWLADCREGKTDPDSLLERERTAEEKSREALAAALHRDFLLRAPAWERERFLEAYRRNFPLMR